MGPELIITNGDAAGELLRSTMQGAEILPWRDVLHEGPVPKTDTIEELSEIRADFLADRGWGTHVEIIEALKARDRGLAINTEFDRVTLWFEHDLYDQLQLIQILDWFADHPRDDENLMLVQADDYLGRQGAEELGRIGEYATPVSEEQLELACRAWRAYRQLTPELWASLLDEDLTPLQHLKPAILRTLEELPDSHSGLTRSERQILRAIRSGVTRARELFAACQAQETASFMGDWSFWSLLDALAAGPSPAVDGVEAGPFNPEMDEEGRLMYLESELRLTVVGNEILAAREDRADHAQIDLWLGGTHVTNKNLWRWDSRTKRVVPPKA